MTAPKAPDALVSVPSDRPYMLIVPRDDGFVDVKGPLNNPGLCYDWLGQAFEYIIRRNIQHALVEKGLVTDASGAPLPPPPGGDGTPH